MYNYLDKRSFNSNVEGTGRKNHQINCSKQETWVAVVSFWSQWRAWGYSESVMKLAGSTPMAEVLYTNREQTTKTTPPSNRTPHFITVAFELLSCVQLSVTLNCSMLDSSVFPTSWGLLKFMSIESVMLLTISSSTINSKYYYLLIITEDGLIIGKKVERFPLFKQII